MSRKDPDNPSRIPATDWRTQAREMLPELENEIADAVNPMGLWIEISLAFDFAYNEPRNEDLIRRIYGFASWCLEQPQCKYAAEDLFTCVIVCFYEDIPTNKAARDDMPRWFTVEEIIQNKQVFSYMTSEEEYEELVALFQPDKPRRHKKKHGKIPQ